jgi:X-X-X-Leu-X-X-Gly heptad repeat protein
MQQSAHLVTAEGSIPGGVKGHEFPAGSSTSAALNSGSPKYYDGVEKLRGCRPNRTFSRGRKYSMAGKKELP